MGRNEGGWEGGRGEGRGLEAYRLLSLVTYVLDVTRH